MRYKIGDKVVIRRDLEVNKSYCMDNKYAERAFVDGMRPLKGETREIAFTADGIYKIHSGWAITDDMIDHESTAKLNEIKPKYLIKNGMVVEFRTGEKMLALVGGDMETQCYGTQNICFVHEDLYMNGSSYDDDLKIINKYYEFEGYDIMKIYKPFVYQIDIMLSECDESNLIWERPIPQPEPKVIKMTSAELLTKLGLDGNTKIEIEG